MDKIAAIKRVCELKQACLSCRNCILCENIVDGLDPHVYACGNIASPIIFLAESPGLTETQQKIPLIGKAGQVFKKYILGGLGLKREDVWISNCCLCRPPENRKPTPEERAACLPHLLAQFDLLKPELVVVLGATPMAVMLDIETGITKLAGQKFRSQKFNVDVFVLPHPSFILRTGQYDLLIDYINKLNPLIYNIVDG